jgi:hypothetical protein
VAVGGFTDTAAGESAGELVQAGTEQDYICIGVVHSVCQLDETTCHPWYEQYPYEAQVEIADMTISPGDEIWVNGGAADTTTASWLLCDGTANVWVSPTTWPTVLRARISRS